MSRHLSYSVDPLFYLSSFYWKMPVVSSTAGIFPFPGSIYFSAYNFILNMQIRNCFICFSVYNTWVPQESREWHGFRPSSRQWMGMRSRWRYSGCNVLQPGFAAEKLSTARWIGCRDGCWKFYELHNCRSVLQGGWIFTVAIANTLYRFDFP